MQKQISKNKIRHLGNKADSSEEMKMGLLDALCNLFVLYQYTELSILPPTELRMTLSDMFSKFQLGEIADANETLEAILETIHAECTPNCSQNGHNSCLAHTVFGGLLMEQSACLSCSAKSEPMLRSDYVHYVYAAELISLGKADAKKSNCMMDAETKIDYYQRRFGHLLHECMSVSPRCCPSHDDRIGASDDALELKSAGYSSEASNFKCDGKANVKLFAVEPPMALAISVGWTQTRESAETLRSFLSLMSYTIKLSDLFDLSKQHAYVDEQVNPQPKKKRGGQGTSYSNSGSWKDVVSTDADDILNVNDSYSSDSKCASEPTFEYLKTEKVSHGPMKSPSYLFRGFVCYYGLHYISIFQV
jgi:Ubiquitin carboxyl-terminal hydrolase